MVVVLGRVGEVTGLLVVLITDSSERVCIAAMRVLGEMGNQVVEIVLVGVLGD